MKPNISKVSAKFVLLTILSLLMLTNHAHATLVWDIVFDQDHFVVSPTDSIPLFATVSNDSTAGETIGYYGTGADWQPAYASASLPTLNGTGPHIYGFVWSPVIFSQFDPKIAPGEKLHFLFGTWVPSNGVPADGRYYAWAQGLDLGPSQGGATVSIRRPVEWCVTHDFDNPCPVITTDIPSVPEPASMALLGSGLAVGFLRRKKSV